MLGGVLAAALSGVPSPLFGELCAPCHGPTGRGDGPAATLLLPAPRDLLQGAFRNGETEESIRRTLLEGMPATGMPAFGALTNAEIDSLVEDVRRLRATQPSPPAAPVLWPARPLPALPPPTPGTPPILTHLSADACARCHPGPAAQWSLSRHALAFGLGVQLQQPPDLRPPDPACSACHAPLEAQQRDAALRGEGVTCAACHRRGDTTLSPRASVGRAGPVHPVRVEPAFGRAEQCLPCHSLPMSAAVNGRPLLDTWREWALSPYFVARIHCQTCHFAGGDHSLRGAHDPEAVRRAVRLTVAAEGSVPVATVENIGAGHAFPTTATPRVVLRLRQLGVDEVPLDGTERLWAIGRTVVPPTAGAGWREVADTRLVPGQRRRYPYDLPRAPGATAVEVELFMYPDWLYGRIFSGAAKSDPRFEPAAKEARGSGFRVTGIRWSWPGAASP